jgi:hypothetical protein
MQAQTVANIVNTLRQCSATAFGIARTIDMQRRTKERTLTGRAGKTPSPQLRRTELRRNPSSASTRPAGASLNTCEAPRAYQPEPEEQQPEPEEQQPEPEEQQPEPEEQQPEPEEQQPETSAEHGEFYESPSEGVWPPAAPDDCCVVVVWNFGGSPRALEMVLRGSAVTLLDADAYAGGSCLAAVASLDAAERQGCSLLWCDGGCPEDVEVAVASMQDHARDDDGRCFGCVSSRCGTLTFVSAASVATARRILQRAAAFPAKPRAFGPLCQEMAWRRGRSGGRLRASPLLPWRLIDIV